MPTRMKKEANIVTNSPRMGALCLVIRNLNAQEEA